MKQLLSALALAGAVLAVQAQTPPSPPVTPPSPPALNPPPITPPAAPPATAAPVTPPAQPGLQAPAAPPGVTPFKTSKADKAAIRQQKRADCTLQAASMTGTARKIFIRDCMGK